MIRKSLVFTLLLYSNVTLAWHHQYYVGIGVGPDTGTFNQNGHIFLTPLMDVNDKEEQGAMGIFGSAFAGVKLWCNQLFAGLEINGNLSTLKVNSSNKEFIKRAFSHTSYKIKNNYGVSILPGYLYNGLLFYGRLGYANGEFSTKTTDQSLENIRARLDGVRYGLGMEVELCPCMDFRMEWSHINYRKTEMHTVDPHSFVSKNTHISPHTNQFEFGLLYHFG